MSSKKRAAAAGTPSPPNCCSPGDKPSLPSMFVSTIRSFLSKSRVDKTDDEDDGVQQERKVTKQAEEYESDSTEGNPSDVSSCSTVLSSPRAIDSRVTVYHSEHEDEEIPPQRGPFRSTYVYREGEQPPVEEEFSASDCSYSEDSSLFEEVDEEEEKENLALGTACEWSEEDVRRVERMRRLREEEEEAAEKYQLRNSLPYPTQLMPDREERYEDDYEEEEEAEEEPIYANVNALERHEELALGHRSRSLMTLNGSEKDCFGYEFERLSEADFSYSNFSRSKSLRSVGIDYTPTGGAHAYKRDSYVSSAPAPPPHRSSVDVYSSSSSSHYHPLPSSSAAAAAAHRRASIISQQSPAAAAAGAKPVPIDGVIGAGSGYRARMSAAAVRDSASASPHAYNNRRSFQQLNSNALYANLSGSYHEFPLAAAAAAGGGGSERKPPIPHRSSLISESTVSSAASPVVMRQHHSAAAAAAAAREQQQYNSTPVSSRRGLELHNGYGGGGGGGGMQRERFTVAAPIYYDEPIQHHHHQQQQLQQLRHMPSSSHRSSKAHRMSSGGIAVTSSSGQRGMVTSISHHDGYPNGGYTMEEYDDHSGSSSAASLERDQKVLFLEDRLRAVEQQLAAATAAGNPAAAAAAVPPSAAAAAAAGTPTFARSARHHAQSSRVGPPTPMDAAALAEKDAEISKLQKRLEQQQVRYEQEIHELRTSTESVSGEHSVFKHKLERMQRELDEYKDKAGATDAAAVAAAASERIEEKDSELSTVRAELDRLKREKDQLEKRQEQIEFLQMQNETLNERLDEREGDVKTLQEQLVTLRLEQSLYQQSCSSGSTPLADEETRSLDVTRTPTGAAGAGHLSEGRGDSASVLGGPAGGQLARVRQYQKAHSTLGASGIAITPSSSSTSPFAGGATPKSGGLAKSLSNYHLEAAGVGRAELPPALSVMLRKTHKLSVDSRSLAHCIRECAEKTLAGEQPDTSLLVGKRTRESHSDSSDCEVVTDCTKMSMEAAEKTLRQQEVTLSKLQSSLEGMRMLLQQVYQRRFQHELDRGDEACRVQ